MIASQSGLLQDINQTASYYLSFQPVCMYLMNGVKIFARYVCQWRSKWCQACMERLHELEKASSVLVGRCLTSETITFSCCCWMKRLLLSKILCKSTEQLSICMESHAKIRDYPLCHCPIKWQRIYHVSVSSEVGPFCRASYCCASPRRSCRNKAAWDDMTLALPQAFQRRHLAFISKAQCIDQLQVATVACTGVAWSIACKTLVSCTCRRY